MKTVVSTILFLCMTAAMMSGADPTVQKKHPRKDESPVSIRVWVDKSTVTIGERIRYFIEVRVKKGYVIQMPEFGENLKRFIIRDFHREEPEEKENGMKVFRQWYDLDIFFTGSYVIPALMVEYRDPGANKDDTKELKSGSVFVEVKSVAEEGELNKGLRDIRDAVELPEPEKPFPWIAAAAGAVILIVAAVVIIRRMRLQAADPTGPILRPHEKAMNAIRSLRTMNVETAEQTKAFYIRISETVRYYLEEQFHLRAPEMTTEEFLKKVAENQSLNQEWTRLLRDFMMECDLVKFAKHVPVENERENVLSAAEKFVQNTIPGESHDE